jgi:tetratricopeptide (TPR) repeat protein
VLRYRQERIVEALDLFEDALAMASRHGDRMAEARSLKNVGAALRRLGEFREALRAFLASLDIYRRDGGDSPGPVLNNIADVYRNLRDPAQATRYYEEALAEYRRRGETIEAAHTLESMAALALDEGDAAHASAHLAEALAVYERQSARSYELRVHAGLARAAIARDELAKAREWVERGFAIAAQLGMPAPAPLTLQAARAMRLSGAPARAAADLEAAVARLPRDDIDRAGLIEELANAREAAGDAGGALAALREFHAADLERREAEHDRELSWLRTRFETSERDRRIAALTTENEMRALALRQRTIVLWLTLACALVAALAAASARG